jgi:hypothetical protein
MKINLAPKRERKSKKKNVTRKTTKEKEKERCEIDTHIQTEKTQKRT